MRKIKPLILSVIIGCFLIACHQSPEQKWAKQDLTNTKHFVESIGGPFLAEETAILTRPPFYQGELPLKLTAHLINIGNGLTKPKKVVLCDDYGDWKNIFLYKDANSIYLDSSNGAVAISKGNHILADAKVRKKFDIEKRFIGIEIKEAHYNQRGDMIFTSVFEIDQTSGFKIKEISSYGKKEKEYFFLWSSRKVE
jgi:hypothetical protein